MDIERTIHFILEAQAKTEVRLDGITKLLQQGMRMLVKTNATVGKLAEAQRRTEKRVEGLAKELKELAQAQKATERSLKALMDSLRNGRNGH